MYYARNVSRGEAARPLERVEYVMRTQNIFGAQRSARKGLGAFAKRRSRQNKQTSKTPHTHTRLLRYVLTALADVVLFVRSRPFRATNDKNDNNYCVLWLPRARYGRSSSDDGLLCRFLMRRAGLFTRLFD